MENSTQALYMSFAVMLFVIALSITIGMFTKARQTADIVLKTADETSYYDYETYSKSGTAGENRIVGMETIIPALYKYSKEDYTIRFLDGTSGYDYNNNATNISVLDKLPIYTTKVYKYDEDRLDEKYQPTNSTNSKATYNYFDISAEETRQEPWTINPKEIQKHLDAILNGSSYTVLSDGSTIDYSTNNPLYKYRSNGSKFIELVGRETTTNKDVDPNTGETLGTNKTTTKTVITYILIKN